MTTLSEADSKALLAGVGVPVLRADGDDADEAARAAADELGYPVVVKLCGDHIAHKTERGLVRLGLGDAAAVRRGGRPSCSARRRPTTATSRCWSRRWCTATASSSPVWPTTRSSA